MTTAWLSIALSGVSVGYLSWDWPILIQDGGIPGVLDVSLDLDRDVPGGSRFRQVHGSSARLGGLLREGANISEGI